MSGILLDLSRKQFVDSDIEQFVLPQLTSNVEQLDLSSNSISDEGIEVLANAMSTQSKLTKLSLAYNNGLTAHCVVSMLNRWSSLQSLSLRGCRQICRQFDSVIAPQLRCNTTLRSLDVAFSTPPNGMSSLIDVLHSNTTINAVDISNNTFGSESSLVALSRMLRDNRSLTSLNALTNGTTIDGVKQLLHSLVANSSLLEINLPDLQSAVVDEFIAVLTHNVTLKAIMFDSRTDWSQQQCVAVFDSLSRSTSIVQFEKYGGHAVSLEEEATDAFVKALRANRTLKKLRFSSMFFDDAPVVEALESNHTLIDVRLAHSGLIEAVCRRVSERNKLNN